YKATVEVVHEISGAIIAITLVMTAVFIPVTFVPGPVGVFYRQFGIAMATAIILSGVVALTLTPVLCAMFLKPHGHPAKRLGLLALMNRRIDHASGNNAPAVRAVTIWLLSAVVAVATYFTLHNGFIRELVSEQLELSELRIWVLTALVTALAYYSF